jgi:hypothetical protein
MKAWQNVVTASLLATAAAGNLFAAENGSPASWRETVEADWLRQDAKRSAPPAEQLARKPNPAEDAAGGVDGVINGKWGFHTENEENPWWQVDLQQPIKLARMVLYNRCELAERNARIKILISLDGENYRQIYQHTGTVFYGFTDKKPLEVKFANLEARWVRLALSGKSYFHLDEVEIYAAGAERNVALNKPATQSSISQWSDAHEKTVPSMAKGYPIHRVLERGLKLAESQKRLGANVQAAEGDLRQIAEQAKRLSANATDFARRELYLRAHWAVRKMALQNPLLDFDRILFVKRAPTMFPHMSDQHYGWWARPGGGIYVMTGFATDKPQIRCLTSDMPPGNFSGPEVSYDGKKVLFAYCKFYPHVADMEKVNKEKLPTDVFYHIYEMDTDGSQRRQLTYGRYDDFDPRYLPNGEVAFLSTRKGLAVQCTKAFSDSTRAADLPDSYVRCGGDSRRPVPVFTLHTMDGNGKSIRPLSAFENFEWTPSVADDGRLLYTRWDYIDRFNGHFFSLWSANQDGANPQLVYGNYTVKPQVKFEARSVPGSTKLVITAGAHHSITGGSLCLLDREKGTEFDDPLVRLTPEVVFPETGGWPEHYYANPWPLSEEYFLVAWSDRKLPPHMRVTDDRNPVNAMGIYLYDAFGNQELLHRDPEISSMYPLPLAPRPKPVVQANIADFDGVQEGGFFVQDVYQGLAGVARGKVKQLRIIGVPPKVQPYMNNPVLGVSAEDPGKFVLGTVPVEADGSAYFRVPSGVPVFFQAMDENGVAVQTMRSLTYLMPNQTLACIGCHEHRDAAPAMGRQALAAARTPSKLTPGPPGAWPLRYDQLVQPVLDRLCVECHRPGSTDAQAAKLDLTPAKSYQALISFGGEDLKKKAFERDRSLVGQGTCATSKLWALLIEGEGHKGVKLDQDSRARLTTWMDTYAQRLGHFSDQQEKELAALRVRLSALLLEPGQ